MMTVADIAARLGGRLEGPGDATIRALAALEDAGPGDLAFLASRRYAAHMATTRASAVLVSEDWQGETVAAVIRVADPDRAFTEVAVWMAPEIPRPPAGVHPTAVVAPDAELGRDVSIGPLCVIEHGVRVGDRTVLGAGCILGYGARVGEDCRFHPHVTVREHVRIGSRVVVHNGAVIGSDGFGYRRVEGRWQKVPQTGIVVIGDDVEIGANTTIDRARFGETRIGNGVKLDNLVQVAHNVAIGDDSAVAGLAGLAGSARLGRRVQIGGQAGVGGHLRVGDDAAVGARSGASKDVPPRTFVTGCRAVPHREALRQEGYLALVPELKKRLAAVEERLRRLEAAP